MTHQEGWKPPGQGPGPGPGPGAFSSGESLKAFVSWTKGFGYKVPLLLISLLVVAVFWVSPTPSFLSYDSQPTTSQIQDVLDISVQVPVHPYDTYDPDRITSPRGNFPEEEKQSYEKLQPPQLPDPIHQQQTESPVVETTGDQIPLTTNATSSSTVFEIDSPPESLSSVENSTKLDEEKSETVDHDQIEVSALNSNSSILNGTTTVRPVADAEDTQLVDLTRINETAVQDDSQQPAAEEEPKYIMPLLTYYVGTGNQLIEYKSAIVVARALNRTLCLAPFFLGPGRHFGYLGDRHSGLYMEERYNISELAKFVKVASMPECMQACAGKIDTHWRLRKVSKAPQWESWFNDTPRVSVDFDRNSPGWSTTADVAGFLGPRNEPKCVGLGGLFPGLRWKGVYFASSAYLTHSKTIMKVANNLQMRALGSLDSDYVSVHWRYEESNCRGHPLGLCFSRCTDGAVIANGRRSETWENMTREGKKLHTKDGFNGVAVTQEDVAAAIYDRAITHGTRSVYLATDGWLRGPESTAILKWVVENVRSKGVNVAGLWQIYGLPNFADGTYVVAQNIGALFGLDQTEKVSNHMIALVEQELCVRSKVFIGSGQSSWSLAVSDTRRGLRCKDNIEADMKEENPAISDAALNNQVIDKILTIQYTPGPTCRGGGKNHSRLVEPSENEDPDGWLDYDACEGRLLNGTGTCKRIST